MNVVDVVDDVAVLLLLCIGVGDYTMPVEEVKGASSFNNAIGDSMMSEIERHAKNVPVCPLLKHCRVSAYQLMHGFVVWLRVRCCAGTGPVLTRTVATAKAIAG